MTTKRKPINLKLKTPRIVVAERDKYCTENWYPGEQLLFLGEIQNMRGHVVVVNREGKVFWGYHPENFREATDMDI